MKFAARLLTCGAILTAATVFAQDGDNADPETEAISNVFDSDAPPPLRYSLGGGLSLGADIELEYDYLHNEDLDDSDHDDEGEISLDLGISAQYLIDSNIRVYGEFELKYENVIDGHSESDTSSYHDGRIVQFYLEWDEFLHEDLRLTIGRQRYDDDREWLIDEELDGILLELHSGDWSLDLAVYNKLFDTDGDEDDAVYFLGWLEYEQELDNDDEGEIEYALFVLAIEDRYDDSFEPIFVGFQVNGEPTDEDVFWIYGATVFGEEDGRNILGWGFDIGYAHEFDCDLKPNVSLSIAYGSGDDDSGSGTDNNFRQSGVQDNNDRLFGRKSYNYYGEVLEPELSNLTILTASAGFEPFDDTSVSVIYHYYYLNDTGADELRDVDLDDDLTGDSHDVGHEIDLVIGSKITEHLKAAISMGYFFPGNAMEEEDGAFGAELELEYTF